MEVGLKKEEILLKDASEKTENLINELKKEKAKANKKAEEVEATTNACKLKAE